MYGFRSFIVYINLIGYEEEIIVKIMQNNIGIEYKDEFFIIVVSKQEVFSYLVYNFDQNYFFNF